MSGGAAAGAEVSESLQRALLAARSALTKKAYDVLVLDMTALVPYTDYFVICSGENTQQVGAMADAVEEALRLSGARPIGIEGRSQGQWVLLDYGDVVVHVFLRETREYYDIERLWLDAPRIEVDEGEANTPALARKDAGAVSGRGR